MPLSGEITPAYVLEQYGPSFNQSIEADANFLRMHTLRQYGHLIYSDNDMPILSATANNAGACMETFGLLETIRIERRMGISLGRSFEWENYYPINEGEKLPAVDRPLFHWLRAGWRLPLIDRPAQDDALAEFYDRLISAANSHEVVHLSIEWRDKIFPEAFPQIKQNKEQSQGQGQGQDDPKTLPTSSKNFDELGNSSFGDSKPGDKPVLTQSDP